MIELILLAVLISVVSLFVSQVMREYYWLQSLGGINSIFDVEDDLFDR